MGLGTIYLLCYAGVVLVFISGDRSVYHPNNSLIGYLDSSRSHALSCINTGVPVLATSGLGWDCCRRPRSRVMREECHILR